MTTKTEGIPSIEELLAVFDALHEQLLEDIVDMDPEGDRILRENLWDLYD